MRQAGLLMLFVALAIPLNSGAAASGIITSASEVLALSPEQAGSKIPVSVTGTVTLAEPGSNWKGMFFVQDSTSGVFVTSKTTPPIPGDIVQVSGVTAPGKYSPVIASPHWTKLGTGPLPEAKPVSVQRFMSGAEDGQRVEVPGLVRWVQPGELRTALEVESGGDSFHASIPVSPKIDLNSLVGAKVRLRGTTAVSQNAAKGGEMTVVLYVPLDSDVIIDQPPAEVNTNKILGTASELLALTPDEAARQIHLSITGVVTVLEPNWKRHFFVQDSTGGAFVNNTRQPQPALGDVVQIEGISHLGGYAPDIMDASWKKLGTAPLPNAKPVSVDWLMSGVEDGQRIEVSGVVRSVHPLDSANSRLNLELASGGYRFKAFVPVSITANPNSLVGAAVRVRGTPAASFNQTLRHIKTVAMFVPQESDFIVDKLPGTAISQEPFTPLTGIAQYRHDGSPELRIRVKGVVTFQRPGEDIFLHDKTGSLRVECTDTNPIAQGGIVEAIGFPGLERFLPVLQDAIVIRTKEFQKPITPQKVSVRELIGGFHHSEVISLRGELLDCSLRPLRGLRALSNAPAEIILTLQNGTYFFSAKAPATRQFAGLASIPLGSTLEVSGICVLQPDEHGKMETAQVLLPATSNIRILKRPGWWTPRRLLIGLGSVLAVSLVGMAFTLTILRKNSALKSAHDLLESRVEERTKELKFEMDARNEAEVQMKATIAERRRIAQELHDTLLQGFTGIGLRLDTLASNLPPALSTTKEQLQKMLDQSDEYLSEARRAVWELRSPSLEKVGDFSKALEKVSKRALADTAIPLALSVQGAERKLKSTLEDNLARICEEAVANAVKHARPTRVEVTLQFDPESVRLRIRDNGCGFALETLEASKHGHFGLLGMMERVKAQSGTLSIDSAPGKGTTLLVTIPTEDTQRYTSVGSIGNSVGRSETVS
jgi:signal transduction histidine kinase